MKPKKFVAERSGACLQRESARLGSEKRCRPASAWSPPSWKKFDAKHREAPTISLDPPGTRRMLLKMEKDVNACLRGGILEGEVELRFNGRGESCVPRERALEFGCRKFCDRKSGGKTAALHEEEPLALAISCGRLAAFTAPLSDSRDVCAAAVGRAENFYSEVALHGPRSSDRHLADYVHQHLLLYRQDVVVADRRVRCSGGHRSSFHHYIYPDGHCVRGRAGAARIFCVEVSRTAFCAAGALRARQ